MLFPKGPNYHPETGILNSDNNCLFSQLEGFLGGKMSLVRPTSASLNSLAAILRQAQPLYTECRSILNCLDGDAGIVILSLPQDPIATPGDVSANKDAHSLPHSILEPMPRNRKSIM